MRITHNASRITGIDLGTRFIDYEIRRSAKARYARLEVHLHRGVRVILPHRASEADAEKLIRSKSTWLLRHLAKYDRLRSIVPDRRFVTGERLPYLDETLTLEVVAGPARAERRGDTLFVATRHPRLAIEDWYVAQAENEIAQRVEETTRRHGIKIRGVRISRAQTRWGSCSSTGWINVSWRMMLAPSAILDYLIAHELAHVGHPDHSPAFWDRVAELCPAYADSERWLKRNGAGLVL